MDLINFNIGGGDRSNWGGFTVKASTVHYTRATPRRGGPTEDDRRAKKFLSTIDVLAFDPEAMAAAIWENSGDAMKDRIYTLVNALLNEPIRRDNASEIFTLTEQEIAAMAKMFAEKVLS